jgi:hypothetical protein
VILGKEIGSTPNGCKYIIYQDSPNTFHYTVSKNDIVYYDYKENPTSMEDLHASVNLLAEELDMHDQKLYISEESITTEQIKEEVNEEAS